MTQGAHRHWGTVACCQKAPQISSKEIVQNEKPVVFPQLPRNGKLHDARKGDREYSQNCTCGNCAREKCTPANSMQQLTGPITQLTGPITQLTEPSTATRHFRSHIQGRVTTRHIIRYYGMHTIGYYKTHPHLKRSDALPQSNKT